MSVERVRGWSTRKRLVVLLSMVAASFAIRRVVAVLTGSAWIHILVDLTLTVALLWMFVTWMRVLLRESQDEVKKNPRPW